jgi:hypothetical protein
VSKNWLFASFLKLFEALLLKSDTREIIAKKEEELRDRLETKKAFEQLNGAGVETN